MLALKGITKRFGTLFAVKNLSFDVNECEFVVLFGPAGAGKTTTLRLIAGIAKENYGDILFNGQSLKQVPPERRNFSMVFENYALYSHLTVFENLAFPLRARRMSDEKVTQLVKEMGALLHIETMLDRKPGYLSGGQRQRVALGRCLIRDAHLYLLDEPISHLDARLRIQMRAELKKICLEKESTVIHVTHDYREAMALADKVIVLNQGTIMQEGTPENVFLHPANEFVASFIGNPPMSFIEVKHASENGQFGYRIAGSDVYIPANNQHNLHSVEGQKLKLGLRATKTSIAREKDDFHNTLAEIYIVESQGHRNLTTVKIGEQLLQVVTRPDEVWEVGDCAWIALHANILHLFADGEAVIHPN